MHELTRLIKDDMKPALGVTEPGAIAFSAAKARACLEKHSGKSSEKPFINVAMNSGMYKNAFTCGIPGSPRVGSVYAAALGYVAGDAEAGLRALAGLTEDDNTEAEKLVSEGRVTASLSGITSRIFIETSVETEKGKAVVTIKDSHTNITCITVDDEVIFGEREQGKPENSMTVSENDADIPQPSGSEKAAVGPEIVSAIRSAEEADRIIHRYTLAELVSYADTVDIDEIAFIDEAYDVNMELFSAGKESSRTDFLKHLLAKNGGVVFSDDEQKTASLLCNGAIEARVLGLDRPAMSITGSGAHGIIATMPLMAAHRVSGYTHEQLLRATALSYLICTYIKEYSGRLSAFCGCAIAAGSGMACALVYLRGGTVEMMAHTLNNMASSITGMICDGGNQGCTMKGIAAVDAAYQSADLAMNGVHIHSEHGINGRTPEETMRNIGLIASPGMTGTEKTIVEIFEQKQ